MAENQVIVTKWKGHGLTAVYHGKHCQSILPEMKEENALGTIVIGKVKNVVKNIGAAFVDLGDGSMGYFSLAQNPYPLLSDELTFWADEEKLRNSEILTRNRKLRQGDELLLQISKDAIKTKSPSVTSCLSFSGTYSVLTVGNPKLGFSNKIKDEAWKKEAREQIKPLMDERFGLIIRTNAPSVPLNLVLEEIKSQKQAMEKLFLKASCRMCYSKIETGTPTYLKCIKDMTVTKELRILTDVKEYFDTMEAYIKEQNLAEVFHLEFYEEESPSLMNLYRIEKEMQQAINTRVWMKSGGYLIIEPTEALTVIDVNSGKFISKKTPAEMIKKLNQEAAVEVARQLRLRNLSGIIIVDFIDMETEEDKKALLDELEAELSKDTVPTHVVDMTKLGLVEITRKKIRKPLHEMIRE